MHLNAFPHPHNVNYTLVGMAVGVTIIPPLILSLLFLIVRWL
jgi:hypothetical protein